MSSNKKFYQGTVLDKELRALYEEGGKLPDMSRLEHKRHRRTVRVLFGLVIFFGVFAAASWAGFLLFGSQSEGGEVKLELRGPETVVSGLPQTITLNFENRDREPLAFGTLRLRVPDNLIIENIEPTPDDEKRLEWNFGTLAPKSSGAVTMTVIPFGVVDDKLEIQALFSFKPANFNAEFQTSQTHIFNIKSTAVETTLEGPQVATAGQELAFVVQVRNVTDKDLEALELSIDNPGTLAIEKQEPETSPPGVWEVTKLAPGEEREVKFTAIPLSVAQGAQTITFRVDSKRGDELYPLNELKRTIDVKNTELQVDLIVNDTPHLKWIRLGEELKIAVKLENRAKDPLSEITTKVKVAGELVDWTAVQTTAGVVLNDNTIHFPKEEKATLPAGNALEFMFQAPIRSEGTQSFSPFIDISAEVQFGQTVVRTPLLRLVVVSDLKLFSEARYFSPDGTPLGRGPLPPRVGEETEFIVRFRLTNTFHDLSNIVATASLPPNVSWKEVKEVQGGRLTFDETKREVRFEIARLPVTTPELTAQFKVGATPQENDRGGLVLLLNVARVEALDTISQVTFSTDTPPLSSSLEADPQGRGKGVVE